MRCLTNRCVPPPSCSIDLRRHPRGTRLLSAVESLIATCIALEFVHAVARTSKSSRVHETEVQRGLAQLSTRPRHCWITRVLASTSRGGCIIPFGHTAAVTKPSEHVQNMTLDDARPPSMQPACSMHTSSSYAMSNSMSARSEKPGLNKIFAVLALLEHASSINLLSRLRISNLYCSERKQSSKTVMPPNHPFSRNDSGLSRCSRSPYHQQDGIHLRVDSQGHIEGVEYLSSLSDCDSQHESKHGSRRSSITSTS